MHWRVGIDIGGAFTDLYALNPDNGQAEWVKIESTPPNFEEGVLCGLAELEKKGIRIKDIQQIIHGQTVVINTITTRTGANVGFITTSGFDIVDIQRANRRDIFNFKYMKPFPFVSRYMTAQIKERITSEGHVLVPLNEKEVERAVEILLEKGADSLAIGFINSYQNSIHEVEAQKVAEEVYRKHGRDEKFVTISSSISREWREYERFNTAILNAYVQPVFVRYLARLEQALRERGFKGTFYLTLASGGMSTSEYAKIYPITTIEGGPIAGIMGGVILGEVLGEENIIVIDGGSTTTKAGLVEGLRPRVNTEYWVEQDEWHAGYPLKVPVMDIHEIGTGGTSIVWADEAKNLQVGPKAAGARPGPVCYGKGGEEPTLTDAYVVCGYLNPNYLLGGRLKLHKSLAEEAFRRIARELKMDVLEVAYGAVRVANDNSSNLIRLISIRRGYDPREFTLIAHGGAGPMLAAFIAEDLGIPKIIVPTIPSGVFNAWGMIGLDIRHELVQTRPTRVEETEAFVEFVNFTFKNLEGDVKNAFRSEYIDPNAVQIFKYLDMKYEGQAHTIKVPLNYANQIRVNEWQETIKLFHKLHFEEFGFSLPESEVEVVNFHMVGLYRVPRPVLRPCVADEGSLSQALIEERKVYNGVRKTTVPVYKQEKLPNGARLEGPCIIEGETATVVVTDAFQAFRDLYGNIVMTQRGKDDQG